MTTRLTIEEAKEYNRKIAESRTEGLVKNMSMGCVGARACENCGLINSSSCMCIGMTCVECGTWCGVDTTKFAKVTSVPYTEFLPTPSKFEIDKVYWYKTISKTAERIYETDEPLYDQLLELLDSLWYSMTLEEHKELKNEHKM